MLCLSGFELCSLWVPLINPFLNSKINAYLIDLYDQRKRVVLE